MGLCLLQISMSLRQIRNESTKGKDLNRNMQFFSWNQVWIIYPVSICPTFASCQLQRNLSCRMRCISEIFVQQNQMIFIKTWMTTSMISDVRADFLWNPKGSDGLAANSRSICFGIPGWLLCIVTTSSDPTNTSGFGSPY